MSRFNQLLGVVSQCSARKAASGRRLVTVPPQHRLIGAVLGLPYAGPLHAAAQQAISTPGGFVAMGFGISFQHVRQVHTSAVLCADGAVSAQSSPLLLVRFGAGPYRVLRPPQGKDIGHFLDIDAGMLVKTVRQDETFAVSMERVAQDQCKMLVAVSAQDEEPLAAESAKAVELTGAKTLRKLVGSTPKGHVWIDIQSLAVGALSKPPAELAASTAAGRRLVAAIKDSKLEQWPPAALGQAAGQDIEQQTYLVRLDGAEWPQLGSSPLFVRPFYLPCIKGVMRDLDPDVKASVRRFIVLGNGGIGKSAFGLLLLRHALLQQPARPVIYLSDKTEDAWVFKPDGNGGHGVKAFMKRDLDAQAELKDPRTVLLADSLRPPQVAAFTVMITSPARERYKDFFSAQPCKKLSFDPFDWKEMVDMRDSCFPTCSMDRLREGYALSGGVPRMVFAYDIREALHEVRSALTKITLPILANDIDSPEADSRSHRLLHMYSCGRLPPEDGAAPLSPMDLAFYQPSHSELASRQVAEFVYRRLDAIATQQLHAILARPPSEGILSLFFGELYEPAALAVLAKGGKFSRLDVQTGTEDTSFELPKASKTQYVDKMDQLEAEFAQDGNQLLVPRSKSFTTIDAVLPGGLLTNVKINLKHVVKLRGRGKRQAEGLLPAAAALGIDPAGTGPIDLYWAMPDERYQELKRDVVISNKKKDVASHFTLVIPEEEDMLARVKQLTSKAAEDTTDSAREAAKRELDAYQRAMEPKVKEWQHLKGRVRHFALCVQFQGVQERPLAAGTATGAGSGANAAYA